MAATPGFKVNWNMIVSIVIASIIVMVIQALATKKVTTCSATGNTSEEKTALNLSTEALIN